MLELDVTYLPAKQKSSIFALLLAKLDGFETKDLADRQQITILITTLKQALLNHNFNLSVLKFHVLQASKAKGLSTLLQLYLKGIGDALSSKSFSDSFAAQSVDDELLDARILKQLESQLAIHLIKSPSFGMWDSVKKISNTIIQLIKDNKNNHEAFKSFLEHISGKSEDVTEPNVPFAYGHFSKKMNLDDVVSYLEDPKELTEVMLIHFMFVRDVLGYLDVKKDLYKSVISKSHQGTFYKFLQKKFDNYSEIPLYFTQYTYYEEQVYSDRGRAKFLDKLDKRLGIVSNIEDRQKMPEALTLWSPDCICQKVDYESPYVQSLVKKEIPYVAGPSGMTSVFLGALTLLGQFNTEQEKNYYLLAVLAYMVSGGLHSIHEVLSIPKIRLGLLEKYEVTGSHMGNYDDFFALFSKDIQVQDALDKAWKEMIQWLKTSYPLACSVKEDEITDQKNDKGPCLIL